MMTYQGLPELQPCMGGWCTARGSCGHYHSRSRVEPAERLCRSGDAAHVGWIPVAFARPEHRQELVLDATPRLELHA